MLVLSAVTTQFGRLFHMLTTLLVKQYLRKSYLNRTFCDLISLPLVLNVHALFMNGTTSVSYFPDNILYVSIIHVFPLIRRKFNIVNPQPFNGCHETPHRLHRPPKWVYFEYWNKTVFVALLVSVPSVVQLNKLNRPMAHWQSTMVRATDANRTSESDRRPTGLPRLRSAVADYAASACITGVNWLNTSIRSFFVPDRRLYLGPVRTVRPVRCFVTPPFNRSL